MEIREELEVILDTKDEEFDKISFIKELGFQSDSVGWMKFKLDQGINQVRLLYEKAKEKGLYLRGDYIKKVHSDDAEWFRFAAKNEFSMSDRSYNKCHNDYYYDSVNAYKAPKRCNLMGDLVSQSFVDAYERLLMTGLDFIWKPDHGKYQSQSFYELIPLSKANRFIFSGFMSEYKKKTYDDNPWKSIPFNIDKVSQVYSALDNQGGHLIEIEPMIDNLSICFPLQLDYASMPDTDFAFCCHEGFPIIHLIRRSALEKLVEEGILDWKDFESVCDVDESEQAPLIVNGEEYKYSSIMLSEKEYFEKMHQKLLLKERPKFEPSEKQVITLLKNVKKSHSELFQKPLTKKIADSLVGTPYEKMLPYYKVANGIRLAEDVYEIFSYNKASEMNEKWMEELAKITSEKDIELLKETTVIGTTCSDQYLVLSGNSVLQISWEDHRCIKKWNQLYQFFYENC